MHTVHTNMKCVIILLNAECISVLALSPQICALESISQSKVMTVHSLAQSLAPLNAGN